MNMQVVVVGGGLVGLSTAWALVQRGIRVSVVEKEERWAAHQSGHTSGVVHSGVYQRPGSLAWQLTTAGNRALERFCAEHGVAFRRSGKVIVATTNEELRRLAGLTGRAHAAGLEVRELTLSELREREPHVRALGALWVADSGVCDYPAVATALARALAQAGAELWPGTEALRVYDRSGRAHVLVQGDRTRMIVAQQAVVCAGLQADQLYHPRQDEVRIVPFRGEFAEVVSGRASLVSGLVYPPPHPQLPFLGVQLTRGIDGRLLVGPNAVPALSREGYRRRDVRLQDVRETLGFSGAWRMSARNLGYGASELARSWVKPAFVHSIRRLLPEVRSRDLQSAPAGVRALAVRRDGGLVDDLELRRNGTVLHVLTVPMAAATASLAIGEHIARRL